MLVRLDIGTYRFGHVDIDVMLALEPCHDVRGIDLIETSLLAVHKFDC